MIVQFLPKGQQRRRNRKPKPFGHFDEEEMPNPKGRQLAILATALDGKNDAGQESANGDDLKKIDDI